VEMKRRVDLSPKKKKRRVDLVIWVGGFFCGCLGFDGFWNGARFCVSCGCEIV